MVCTKLSEQCYKARDYTEMEMCGLCKIKSHSPKLCNEQKGVSPTQHGLGKIVMDLGRFAMDTVN